MTGGLPRAAVLAALAAAIVVAYAPALAGMKAMWDATPMYSFGYVVPFVSAYLAWTRRHALAAIRPTPSVAAGGAVFLLAAALLVTGRIATLQIAEQLSFVIALVAVVLFVWGWPTLRTVWLALAYLLLIVPFWDGLTELLHAPFQRLSARIGVALLQAVHIPVFQEGNFIYLPNVTLEVARACSGVNYLVAILALGIPLAYLSLPTNGRRIVLVASAVAVAALSNGLRVALIGALAYGELGTPLHGPAHVLHGLFVSGVGYVVLIGGLHLLTPRPAGGLAGPVPAAAVFVPLFDVPAQRALGAALLFVSLWGALAFYRPVPVPLPRPLATLPAVLGAWQAVRTTTPASTWWHDADDVLHRVYVSPTGQYVEVAIGYFARQSQGREAASHLSAPLDRAVISTVALPADGATPGPLVNEVRVAAPGGSRTGVFWYDVGGRIVTSPSRAKVQTALSVLSSRHSAAFIVVLLDLDTGTNASRTPVQAAAALAAELRNALVRLSAATPAAS